VIHQYDCEELWEVADVGRYSIVPFGVHYEHTRTGKLNQVDEFLVVLVKRSCCLFVWRAKHVRGVFEEEGVGVFDAALFGAGHRVPGNESGATWKGVERVLQNGRLNRADVRDDRTGPNGRSNLVEQPTNFTDGYGKDNNVSTGNRRLEIRSFFADRTE